MPQLSRKGDKNQTGGEILRGASTVFANGMQVGLKGSQIAEHAPYGPPHPPHVCATVITGSDTVFAESRPVAKVGSGNSCGHSIVEGSPDVVVP